MDLYVSNELIVYVEWKAGNYRRDRFLVCVGTLCSGQVCMDVGMPGAAGRQATRKARK